MKKIILAVAILSLFAFTLSACRRPYGPPPGLVTTGGIPPGQLKKMI